MYNYTYEDGTLIRANECDITLDANEIVTSKTVVNTIYYIYDSKKVLVRKVIVDASGNEFVVASENNDKNETTVSFKAGGNTVTSHSKKGGFDRKVFDELLLCEGFLNRSFEYLPGAITAEHTENEKIKSNPVTTLVKSIRYSDGRTIAYEYDAEEKITKVTDSIDGVTDYEYDALSQLVSETVNGVKTKFVYDSCGNILEKGVCDDNGQIIVATKSIHLRRQHMEGSAHIV